MKNNKNILLKIIFYINDTNQNLLGKMHAFPMISQKMGVY